MDIYELIQEIIGGVAILCIIMSEDKKFSRRGRKMNFIGAVMLVTYGVLIHSYMIIIMSFTLTILNMIRFFGDPSPELGCIIIGYQGIGKSTLALHSRKYVDLESSTFWVDGERDVNWYQVYCNIALGLAAQGYRVFTSSHIVVREYLTSIPLPESIKVYECYPIHSLKEPWIEKLEKRYNATTLDKDYKAWMNAVDRFDENISEMEECNAIKIPITTMKYDLNDLISKAMRDNR